MSSAKYIAVEDSGDSIAGKLNSIFEDVVKKLYPSFKKSDDAPYVKETSNAKFGDYQFDMSVKIASQLGIGETADSVNKAVVANLCKTPLIGKVVIVKLYINVFVDKGYLFKRIAEIFVAEKVPVPKVAHRKVIVDFSSPNIAKEMHVGHLRSTIIGDSISRLLKYVGYTVLGLSHIGDWGTQFGMLIAHLQDRFPNYVNETPPIQDLQAFYKESKKRFDEEEAFNARARACVVKLQNSVDRDDNDIVRAWKQICDVSRKDFEKIYERLGISVTERGESFYQSRMVSLVEELDGQGSLQLDEGRRLLWAPGRTTPLTVVKSDGGYTYDTSDLAALKNRLLEEKADWVLYVVDRGQSDHLENVYSSARMLGWYDDEEKRVEHVQFGVVLGEDGKKFKTRSGDTVKLTELLDEGLARAEASLREKREGLDELSEEEFAAAREAIAYGCIKYADLSSNRLSDYVFSFDKMLNDKGNTAVYVLYNYARIKSIVRKAGVVDEQLKEYVKTLGDSTLPLEDAKEIKLARQILKFSDCVLDVLNSLLLHKITDYVYKLATTFSDFYTTCDVLTELRYDRLVLCRVTAEVMLQCFKLLGIRAVEKM